VKQKKLINSILDDKKIGHLCFFNREKYERFYYDMFKEMVYNDEAFVSYMSVYFDAIKHKKLDEKQTLEEIDLFIKSYLLKATDCMRHDLAEEIKNCHMFDFITKTEEFTVEDLSIKKEEFD